MFRQDSYAECYTYYQRAIELYRRKGIIVGVTDALGNFGNMSATKQVMLSEGRAALEEAIALVKEHGLERKLARYYRALAHVLVLLGDLAPVPTTLTEAVQTALRLDNTGELMEVFYVLALYAQTTHMTGLARVAAARVADDPATSELTRGYAANLLTALPLDDPHAVPDDPALSALVSGQPVGT